jgi:hypothetical protein
LEIKLLSFLNLTLKGSECSAPRTDRFNPEGKKKRLSGPQGQFGRLEKEKNPFASVKNGTTILRLPGHSLVTMLNELSGLSHWNRGFVSIIKAV